MDRAPLGLPHRRAARRTFARVRLHLETLEDRTLLDAGLPAVLDLSALSTDPGAYDATRLLVRLQPGVTAEQFQVEGVSLGEALPLVDNLYVANLAIGVSVSQALAVLQSNPFVLYAQPDYELHLDVMPNDTYFGSEWDSNNTGQSGGMVDADVDAPETWDVTTGTGRVIVAVIDTGVDYTHPDLAANIWTNTGEIAGNGVDDDHNGYIDDIHGYDFVNNDGNPMDDNSHGTHVAGTIGAVGNNGIGVAGMIWDVQIMALKFLGANGSGSTSNAIKALNYAVNMGASISNNSWGGGGFDQALYNAIANARTKGHIFVAAAGNSSSNNDTTSFYPANYNLDNVVAVAATDRYDHLASYSNYGATTVDLGAPGTSIYSTVPGNAYAWKSGTSMATPHVAGALALVWDLHPEWTYQQVIDRVLSTVDPLPTLQGKTVTGGRLNLAKAIGTGPVQPVLSIGDMAVVEGDGGTINAVFTVGLSSTSTNTVTVSFATANGTATAGSDYTAANDTLTFAPGDTSKTITIVVSGDTVVEGNETFYVNLSNPTNATIGDSQGLGTIRNDDGALSITDATVTEGDSGTVNAVFTVSLTSASALPVTVDYTTADGTASAGSDYTAVSGTLNFAAGQTSKTITVVVSGDTVGEADESFFVNLSNPTNATILDTQGLGTIRNDDLALSINDVAVVEGNSGTTNAVFTVTLSAPSTLIVTVNYATANGTARNGPDYQRASGTLNFNVGDTTKTITVKVKGDTAVEPDETFFLDLTNASNAKLADGHGVGTIRNDDGAMGAAELAADPGLLWTGHDRFGWLTDLMVVTDPSATCWTPIAAPVTPDADTATTGSAAALPQPLEAGAPDWSDGAANAHDRSRHSVPGSTQSASLLTDDLLSPMWERS